MQVKSTEDAKTELRAAVSGIGEKYKRGVERNSNWKEKASSDAAEELYGAKVSEAVAARRRQKALGSVSQDEWKRAARDKGAGTIGPNLSKSVDKWGKNWGPYRDELSNMELPDRTADPATNVTNRVIPIATGLAAKKREIKG